MVQTARVSKSAQVAGLQMAENSQVLYETGMNAVLSLAAGKAGTLTTRTDNDTGVITTTAVHGLTENDRVDIYWEGGARYGMLVSNVGSTTVVTVGTDAEDVGAGDNLPTEGASVVICKCTEITMAFAGDDVNIMAASFSKRGILVIAGNDNAADAIYDLNGPAEMVLYQGAAGETNPIAGDAIAKLFVSNGDPTNVNTFKFGVGLDA